MKLKSLGILCAAVLTLTACHFDANWKKIELYSDRQGSAIQQSLLDGLSEKNQARTWGKPVKIVYKDGKTYSALLAANWEKKGDWIHIYSKFSHCHVAYKRERELADRNTETQFTHIHCNDLRKAIVTLEADKSQRALDALLPGCKTNPRCFWGVK